LSDNIKEPLFKNCSSDVKKEPIKGFVLTDDETAIIETRRDEMSKVVKQFQMQGHVFVCKTWNRLLKEYVNPHKTVFLHNNSYRKLWRKIDKGFSKEFGGERREILRSLTQTSVHLEEIYKIAIKYNLGKIDIKVPNKSIKETKDRNDILLGNVKELEEFYYNGKLIFELDDDEFPYSEIREKKYDARTYGRFLKTIAKCNMRLKQLEAGNQRPKNNFAWTLDISKNGKLIYVRDKTVFGTNRERKRHFNNTGFHQKWVENTVPKKAQWKERPEKTNAQIRENIRKKWLSLGYYRSNTR
jgi:hypothetical protein